jgi:hypothetical protein
MSEVIKNNFYEIDFSKKNNLIHNCEYKTNSNTKTNTCKLCFIIKFIDEIELHDDYNITHSMICSLRDCPYGDIYHYVYEGCPSCFNYRKE